MKAQDRVQELTDKALVTIGDLKESLDRLTILFENPPKGKPPELIENTESDSEPSRSV